MDFQKRDRHPELKCNQGLGMAFRQRLRSALSLGLVVAALVGCADRHQLQSMPSPDGTFVLIVDTIIKPLGTQDVIVSLEEKRGIATEVAAFRNIQSFSAAWLGPEDIGICQVGNVQTYRTLVTINAHSGNQDFHFHYACPVGS